MSSRHIGAVSAWAFQQGLRGLSAFFSFSQRSQFGRLDPFGLVKGILLHSRADNFDVEGLEVKLLNLKVDLSCRCAFSRWNEGNFNCEGLVGLDNSLERVDADLWALFLIVELEFEVEGH